MDRLSAVVRVLLSITLESYLQPINSVIKR